MSRFLFLRSTAVAVAFASTISFPAYAASKDTVALQAQIAQLQQMIQQMQQSNDERMGVLKDLVQQNADAVNKMTVVVNGLKLQAQNNAEASSLKTDALAGQIQSLNDSLDELKARMQRMEKSMGEVQSQQQQNNAMLANLPQPGAPTTPAGPATSNAPGASPFAGDNPANAPKSTKPTKTLPVAGPSSGDMYRTAYSDYMSGKYPLSTSEFGDLIKAYPDDNLSGNAYFYMGEINLRANKPSAAIKDYDTVIERYPDNAKIPAAHLHKADALVSTKENAKAILELKALIARFPASPEAAAAKAKLAQLKK